MTPFYKFILIKDFNVLVLYEFQIQGATYMIFLVTSINNYAIWAYFNQSC